MPDNVYAAKASSGVMGRWRDGVMILQNSKTPLLHYSKRFALRSQCHFDLCER